MISAVIHTRLKFGDSSLSSKSKKKCIKKSPTRCTLVFDFHMSRYLWALIISGFHNYYVNTILPF